MTANETPLQNIHTACSTQNMSCQTATGGTALVWLIDKLGIVLKVFDTPKEAQEEYSKHVIIWSRLESDSRCKTFLAKPLRQEGNFMTQEYLAGFVPYHEFRRNYSGNSSFQSIDEIVRKQIGRALACLHIKGIIHQDIHRGNILVNPITHKIKIIDFGHSTVTNRSKFLSLRSVTEGSNDRYDGPKSRVQHYARNNLLVSNVSEITKADLIQKMIDKNMPTYLEVLKNYDPVIHPGALKRMKNKIESKVESAFQLGQRRKRIFPNLITKVTKPYNEAKRRFAANLIAKAVRKKQYKKRFIKLEDNLDAERTDKRQAVRKTTKWNMRAKARRIDQLLQQQERGLLENANIYELRELLEPQKLREERANPFKPDGTKAARYSNRLNELVQAHARSRHNQEKERVGKRNAVTTALPLTTLTHRAKRINELLRIQNNRLLKNDELYELRELIQSQQMRNARAANNKNANNAAKKNKKNLEKAIEQEQERRVIRDMRPQYGKNNHSRQSRVMKELHRYPNLELSANTKKNFKNLRKKSVMRQRKMNADFHQAHSRNKISRQSLRQQKMIADFRQAQSRTSRKSMSKRSRSTRGSRKSESNFSNKLPPIKE